MQTDKLKVLLAAIWAVGVGAIGFILTLGSGTSWQKAALVGLFVTVLYGGWFVIAYLIGDNK
jgi:hypothetical protein